MSIAGPFTAGGAFQRNVLSLSFHPSQAIPAGALMFLVVGTNAADTTTITIGDGTANVYNQQVGSQQPGTTASLFVFFVDPKASHALTTGSNITITSSARSDFAASLYFFTGAGGFLDGSDVEWFNTTTPSFNCHSFAGDTLFAMLGVAGPSTDGFTQDANWGADVLSGIATTTFTVHGTSRQAPTTGQSTYAPTLATLRRSVGCVLSFS